MIATMIALLWAVITPDASAAEERLMLNDATQVELAALDGVSDDAAAQIVELRTTRGSLSNVEELRALGLDDETLSSLRSRTSVPIVLPDAATQTFGTPDEVLAQFSAEPSIRQVQDWANDYANMSPRQVERWLAQSVTFATLPQLTLEFKMRDDWDQGFDYVNADGAELAPGEDPIAVAADADQGQYQEYKVRMVWDLDRIVMSSERIRVINEAQDIVKLRDKVLGEVTRLYFERRRLQVERLLAPKTDMLAQVKEELRLMELTANIDALTGGGFSGAVARAGG